VRGRWSVAGNHACTSARFLEIQGLILLMSIPRFTRSSPSIQFFVLFLWGVFLASRSGGNGPRGMYLKSRLWIASHSVEKTAPGTLLRTAMSSKNRRAEGRFFPE